ncbi:MAG: hypothetical protein EA409_06865 [Saprospirales bacterium]|nr:MAG: hypothetical protein EA409_06865 [Saprospirales bacterium]
MEATVELSIYPLHDDYKGRVKDFLKKIRSHSGLTIESNGMSTQIFGPYDLMMDCLIPDIREALDHQQAMIVIKIGKGILRFDESKLREE